MKQRNFVSVIILAMAVVFAFAACEGPDGPNHTHIWGAWTITTAATCTTQGVETRVCTLNVMHTENGFKMIDKLCHNNPDFNQFIDKTEKVIDADEKFYDATKKDLENICDKFFEDDSEIEKYCKAKNIPIEEF